MRGSFYTKNQLDTSSRREDILHLVVVIQFKGTPLRLIDYAMQGYMVFDSVILVSTTLQYDATTYYPNQV